MERPKVAAVVVVCVAVGFFAAFATLKLDCLGPCSFHGVRLQENASTDKPAALVTTLTRIGKDERRFFASIAVFMPSTTVYVACTSSLVETLSKSFLPLDIRTVPVLDRYGGMNRSVLTSKGMWLAFNNERIHLLRHALDQGHDGAWYMDGDTFLLASLPRVDAPVGLSRHRIDPKFEKQYGEWNSGQVFFSDYEALTIWEQTALKMGQKGPIHQISLRGVATHFERSMAKLGCGIDVGGYQMDAGMSADHKAHYDAIQCNNGSVQYRNCTIVSGHWHVHEKHETRPFMERALRECGNPFLKGWLASY